MGIIIMIILGGIIGYIAARMLGRDEGMLASIIIGIIGSFIGGWVSQMFSGSNNSYLSFSWVGLFWSLIGSLILVALMNAFQGRRHHTVQ